MHVQHDSIVPILFLEQGHNSASEADQTGAKFQWFSCTSIFFCWRYATYFNTASARTWTAPFIGFQVLELSHGCNRMLLYSREILVVWQSIFTTAKLKSPNVSYLYIYICWSLTDPPNRNPPIFLQWQFGAQPPNLIPTNIFGYTVISTLAWVSNTLALMFSISCLQCLLISGLL